MVRNPILIYFQKIVNFPPKVYLSPWLHSPAGPNKSYRHRKNGLRASTRNTRPRWKRLQPAVASVERAAALQLRSRASRPWPLLRCEWWPSGRQPTRSTGGKFRRTASPLACNTRRRKAPPRSPATFRAPSRNRRSAGWASTRRCRRLSAMAARSPSRI